MAGVKVVPVRADAPSRTLTIKPPVLSGETAVAFLHRAFTINGRVWNNSLLGREGVGLTKLIHGQPNSAWDVYIGHQPEGLVGNDIPLKGKKHIEFAGQTVRREDWNSRFRRWCPGCWQADLRSPARGRSADWNIHHRYWWDVLAISHCPHHRMKLESTCPQCDRRVHWLAGSMTRCDKGHSLLGKHGVPVPAEECVLDDYLLARFEDPDSPRNSYLDSFDLANVAKVVERLGAAYLDENSSIKELRRVVGRCKLLSTGMRVVSELPGSVGPLLDRVREGASARKGKWGVLRTYGAFNEWVKCLPSVALAEVLRDEMVKHARRNGVHVKTGGDVGGVAVPKIALTLVESAEICGISPTRFRRIAVAVGIKSRRVERGTTAGFSPPIVKYIAQQLDGHLLLNDLAKELRISKGSLKNLIQKGYIRKLFDSEDFTGSYSWLFPRDAATKLISKLEALCIPLGPSDKQWRSMRIAAQSNYTSLADVMGLIFDGKLLVRRGRGAGIGAFQVPISASRTQVRIKRWPGETTADFMKATNLSAAAITNYIREGIIRAEFHGQNWIFQPGEIDRFKQKYITLSELSLLSGIKYIKHITIILSNKGVEPLCKPPIFKKILFLRQDALPAIQLWMQDPTNEIKSATYVKKIPPQCLSAKALSVKLRWDPKLVADMLATGHIAITAKVGHRTYIPKSEIDRLRYEFVAANKLAPLLGKVAPHAATTALKKAGIVPRFRSTDGRYSLFQRLEATEAIEKHLAEQEGDGVKQLRTRKAAKYLGTD